MKAIVCVQWGDKYSKDYVKALKQQVEKHCTYPFNFYCLTDKPTEHYDRYFPYNWNSKANGNFWAYRKTYMFDNIFSEDEILYLDLDVLIHSSLDKFFELDMTKPWIVKGWWNDPDTCRKNYSKMQSPMINSSVIRWNRNQLQPVFNHILDNIDVVFFTYPTIDNYFAHFWYDLNKEKEAFFNVFSAEYIESYYKGRIHKSHKIKCKEDSTIIELFNNSDLSAKDDLEKLWPTFGILQN